VFSDRSLEELGAGLQVSPEGLDSGTSPMAVAARELVSWISLLVDKYSLLLTTGNLTL